MEYQLEKWKRQDWRKQTRHYSCEVRQNLFGQWGRTAETGDGVIALKGQSLETLCDRYEQALKIFNGVARRRARRGYSCW